MLYIAVIGNMNTESQVSKIQSILNSPVELLYDSQTEIDTQYSMYEHITAFAIKLQNRVLYNSTPWITGTSDKAIILLDGSNTDKLVHVDLVHLSNDSVLFDNINIYENQSWMLASVNAIIKICISGKKLESCIDNSRKSYFIGACSNMFKFIWYAYRNGLKVFRA